MYCLYYFLLLLNFFKIHSKYQSFVKDMLRDFGLACALPILFSASFIISLYSCKCLIHLKLCLLKIVRWKKKLTFISSERLCSMHPVIVPILTDWKHQLSNTLYSILWGFVFCLLDLFLKLFWYCFHIFNFFEYLYSMYYLSFFVLKIFMFYSSL